MRSSEGREEQQIVRAKVLRRRDLGRGWIPTPMINNEARLDPYGDDDASQALRAVRDGLVLTALDEGQAWRRRSDGALAVLRVEAFVYDAAPLRQAWAKLAQPCLDALWRQRWSERDRQPGWIEARWRVPSDRPDLLRPASPVEASAAAVTDWLTIEDHTGAAEADAVDAYEHVTVWVGRWVATLVLRYRHGDGADTDATVEGAAVAMADRLGALSRRSGPGPGSA